MKTTCIFGCRSFFYGVWIGITSRFKLCLLTMPFSFLGDKGYMFFRKLIQLSLFQVQG